MPTNPTPHDIYHVCVEKFTRMEEQIKELHAFRERHERICEAHKEELRRDILALKMTLARYAVITVMLGCIGAAVVSKVVEMILK